MSKPPSQELVWVACSAVELSCTLLYLEPVSVKQEALSDKAPGFHLWKAAHPSNLGFEGRGEKEKEANWFISLLLNRWHWIGASYIHSQEAQALAVVPGYRQWGPMAAPQTWLAWGRRLLLGLANCFFRLKKGIWEREGEGWPHGVTPDSLVLKTRTQLVRAQPSGSDTWSLLFFCQNHCGRRQVEQTRNISDLGLKRLVYGWVGGISGGSQAVWCRCMKPESPCLCGTGEGGVGHEQALLLSQYT